MTETNLLQGLDRCAGSHYKSKRDVINADGLESWSSAWLKIDLLDEREVHQCWVVGW